MFNIFRKGKKIKKEDYDFLEAIIEALPSQYSYLIDQVTEDFILDKKNNPLGDQGTWTLILNADLERKFAKKWLPKFFIIKGIGICNKNKESIELVELHIMEGMLAGFKLQAKYSDLDLERIDISRVVEKQFQDEDQEVLNEILGNVPEDILFYLDLKSTFKIDTEEGYFYVIKKLGDGDYLAMDKKGAVYVMIHDPYKVERIFSNKESFFQALKSSKFDVSKFY